MRYVEGYFKETEPHCWVEYGRYIIDVTATQFGVKDPVHVCYVDDKRYEKIDFKQRLERIRLGSRQAELLQSILYKHGQKAAAAV